MFLESILGAADKVDPAAFDAVVTGGGTVFLVSGECVVAYRFVSGVEYLHGREMVRLFRAHPEWQVVGHLASAELEELANTGHPAAQFHMGVVRGLGQGVAPARREAIDWLTRSARQGLEPAMLALGMALSGPGRLEDEAIIVGEAPAIDEHTDLVAACYWLRRASASRDEVVRSEAISELSFAKLMERMSPSEIGRCEQLLSGG